MEVILKMSRKIKSDTGEDEGDAGEHRMEGVWR